MAARYVCVSVMGLNFGFGKHWVLVWQGTTITFRFTNVIFSQYICSQSVGRTFINGLTKRNASFKKFLSIIYGMSVSLLVIILPIDLLTSKAQ